MSNTLEHPWFDPRTNEIIVTHCIIGGGVSGLYAAVRLSQTKQGIEPPRICILEATKRLGGRVATIKIPRSGFHADLGAMRFIPSQPLIGAIVEHYQLPTYDYDFPPDFYFVRGKRITPEQVGSEGQEVYHKLTKHEQRKSPSELVVNAIIGALKEVRVVAPGIPREYADRFGDPEIINEKLRACDRYILEQFYNAFTPREWRTIKLYGHYPGDTGLPLYKLGFWDVIQSQLSTEAYSFVDEGLGYQTIIGTWNAADAIPWFLADFGAPNYVSIDGGMGRIPARLFEEFREAMKNRSDLTPFDDSLFVLRDAKVKTVNWREADKRAIIEAELPGSSGLLYRQINAEHCIVCVSKGAAEKIEFTGITTDGKPSDLKKRFVFAGERQDDGGFRRERRLIGKFLGEYQEVDAEKIYTFEWLLNCVEAQALLKIFLNFQQAWWEKAWQSAHNYDGKPSPQGFRVLTNLPLRQIYYHSARSRSRRPPHNVPAGVGPGEGMVMAYCDAKHASYWDALAFQQNIKYGEAKLRQDEVDEKQILREFGVSGHFAERAHEQIWRVRRPGIDSTEFPSDMQTISSFTPPNEDGKRERETIAKSEFVLYRNWLQAPFFGGWHAWRIGVVSDDAKTVWEKPWVDANVYFAGEALSSDQGWSEGAFRSVERVLMHHLARFAGAPHWPDLERRTKMLGFSGFGEYVEW